MINSASEPGIHNPGAVDYGTRARPTQVGYSDLSDLDADLG